MSHTKTTLPVQVLAADQADPQRDAEADNQTREDRSPDRVPPPSHPTRRDDDRPPNPRCAARALSCDLGLPEDSLDGLLDTPEDSV
jgi:hypothetical protein